MEDVLELYAEPYDARYPVVCFDESPYQLISETKVPLAPEPGKKRRYDYEYRREGTCNLFVFVQPITGWRHIKVTQQRTKIDFAHCMRDLVEIHFPDADCISVVLDNLNTHTKAALYEALEPAEARRLLRKLDFHYTPVHGSWLNMAEIEISVLTRQCTGARIGALAALKQRVGAWERTRNRRKARIDWRFGVSDARTKLKRLYRAEPATDAESVADLLPSASETLGPDSQTRTPQHQCG